MGLNIMKLAHRSSVLAAVPLVINALGSASAQDFGQEASVADALPASVALLISDFDGDGDLDVGSVGSFVTGSAGIWFENLGSGRFTSQRVFGPGATSIRRDAVVADLDGDGDEDIAFCGGTPEGVGWIENLGGGTFSATRVIAIGSDRSDEIQAADVNGDGLIDLVVREQNGRIGWFANQGGGNFGIRQVLGDNLGDLTSFDVADLDLDGDLDVVFCELSSSEIRWFEQTGSGAFASAAAVAASVEGPRLLSVADVNADGTPDLVTVNQSSREVVWRRGLGGGVGAGAYAPSRLIYAPGSGYIAGYTLVDLDGNASLDVIASSSQAPAVQVLNAGPWFQAPTSLPTPPGPRSDLQVGDLDGDGLADLVTAASGLVEMHRRAGPSFDPPVDLQANVDALNGRHLTADFNGDGIADVVIAELGDSDYDVHFGLGNGSIVTPGQSLQQDAVVQIEALDFDGDGDLDLVSSGGVFNPGFAAAGWAENLGDGLFAASEILFSGLADGAATFATGDRDGDGDLDLLVLYPGFFTFQDLSILWIDQVAQGVFASGPVLATNELPANVQLADVDADGIADAIVVRASSGTNSLVWRRGDGTGQFGPEVIVRDASQPFVQDAALGDVDGDGRIDIVASGPGGIDLHLWDALSATFSAATSLEGPMTGSTLVRLSDVTGDGLPDVLASTRFQHPARWFENAGGGSFGIPQLLPEVELGSDILGASDLDGDQDVDILKLQSSNKIAWNPNSARFGIGECGPARPNSSGQAGTISAAGAAAVIDNDVTLIAEHLPASTFGYFLVAPMEGFFPGAGGSQGNLCLGGPIGRLNRGPGEIFRTNAAGTAEVALDLQNVPTPTGAVALTPGDTRHFQAWFRDANPGATSNLTNGLRIAFD